MSDVSVGSNVIQTKHAAVRESRLMKPNRDRVLRNAAAFFTFLPSDLILAPTRASPPPQKMFYGENKRSPAPHLRAADVF